jgi:hypothetical protein
MNPKSAPSFFLGESIPTSNYLWVLQVLQRFKAMELPTVAQETTVPPTGKSKKVTFSKNT